MAFTDKEKELFLDIARNAFGVKSLEKSHSSEDFREVSVGAIEYAIEQAFLAGKEATPPRKWVVCLDEYYVRDAQMYCGDDTENMTEDENGWKDCERPVFIGIFEADSAEEAVDVVHKGNAWINKSGLYAEPLS